MAAQLVVGVSLSRSESLALSNATTQFPDSWRVSIQDTPANAPVLQILMAGPGFVMVGSVRREAVLPDTIDFVSCSLQRRPRAS